MKNLRLAMIAFVLLLLFSVPTMAQEVTEESDVEITVVPTVVVDETVIEEVPVPETSTLSVNIITIVIGLLGAFAAGGAVGVVGIAQYTNRVKSDVPTVTAIEALANSYPPETKEFVENIFKSIKNVAELGIEVFDDVPIADKVVSDEIGNTPLNDVGLIS